MISKKIHYIWLGRNQKDRLSLACINSWRRLLPDYEIIEWNENNLPIQKIAESNLFFRSCMKKKLWAFMSDYLRLYVLQNEGGIYLDTDVEVLKRFDDLLNNQMFLGKESGNYIGTGIIGAERNHPIIDNLLKFYDEEIWRVNYFSNPIIFSEVLNRRLELQSMYTVFPQDYFSPLNYKDNKIISLVGNENTYCIHWYSGNWGMTRSGYVFLLTKQYKGTRYIIEVLRKNMGYFLRKMGLKNL